MWTGSPRPWDGCWIKVRRVGESAAVFALFRVAAGPRIGYGHLRRATVLAHALGRPCALSLRGRATATAGWRLAVGRSPAAVIASVDPCVLIVDDARAATAWPWVRAAQRAGVPCATVHDLGIGALPSDLAIDGSVTSRRTWPARAVLSGPRYAILGPATGHRRRRGTTARRVMVSLGGAAHVALVRAIVSHLRLLAPELSVVVPAGLDGALETAKIEGATVVSAPDGLGPWLARADVAIVGGGVTLYEAAALGVPAVAVPVVAGQLPTVRAFVRHGLALADVRVGTDATARGRRIARLAVALAGDRARRRTMTARGPQWVDGHGASRVAHALRALAEASGG